MMQPKYLILIIVLLIIVILSGGGYFYYQQIQKTPANTPEGSQNEAKKIASEVGKLIELPTGEDPTVATVTDITKLKDQPFFQKAKNGDKVLIYTNAKKAILYDPNLKKVLDIAPINIGSAAASPAEPRVALRNGTTTVGLTSKIETKLKKTIPKLNVVSKGNAEKQNYNNTVVVVVNDSAKDFAETVAKALNATVGKLPAGELEPKDTDIFIILGKDMVE